jgi:hypothetical protein
MRPCVIDSSQTLHLALSLQLLVPGTTCSPSGAGDAAAGCGRYGPGRRRRARPWSSLLLRHAALPWQPTACWPFCCYCCRSCCRQMQIWPRRRRALGGPVLALWLGPPVAHQCEMFSDIGTVQRAHKASASLQPRSGAQECACSCSERKRQGHLCCMTGMHCGGLQKGQVAYCF